jgi:hypothetical protein
MAPAACHKCRIRDGRSHSRGGHGHPRARNSACHLLRNGQRYVFTWARDSSWAAAAGERMSETRVSNGFPTLAGVLFGLGLGGLLRRDCFASAASVAPHAEQLVSDSRRGGPTGAACGQKYRDRRTPVRCNARRVSRSNSQEGLRQAEQREAHRRGQGRWARLRAAWRGK